MLGLYLLIHLNVQNSIEMKFRGLVLFFHQFYAFKKIM